MPGLSFLNKKSWHTTNVKVIKCYDRGKESIGCLTFPFHFLLRTSNGCGSLKRRLKKSRRDSQSFRSNCRRKGKYWSSGSYKLLMDKLPKQLTTLWTGCMKVLYLPIRNSSPPKNTCWAKSTTVLPITAKLLLSFQVSMAPFLH